MKHKPEDVAQVLEQRAKGEKWSVLWMVHGKTCNGAMYQLKKAKSPPTTPGIDCAQCSKRINLRCYFCPHCGIITETGKKAP